MQAVIGSNTWVERQGWRIIQSLVVLLVLLATLTLPCCPRLDSWMTLAATQDEPSGSTVEQNRESHLTHHGSGSGKSREDGSRLHKGHLLATGALDILPSAFASPGEFATTIVAGSHLPGERALAETLPKIPIPPPK